jgi:hypothetical protein
MPLTEQSGLIRLLYHIHGDARTWTNDELDFVRDVGECVRSVVARHEAQIAL